MDPIDHLRTLRRRWPLIVAAPLLALLVAFVLTPTREAPVIPAGRTFQATHTLFKDVAEPPVPLATMAFLATKGELPRRVAAALDFEGEPAVLAAQVTITADSSLGTLTVDTTQSTPAEAVAIVDAFAAEILAYFGERAEAARLQAIDQTGKLLEQQQQQVRALDAELAALPPKSSQAQLVRAERDAFVRQYGGTVERFQQLNAAATGGAGVSTLEAGTAIPVEEEGFSAPTTPGPRRLLATAMGLLLGVALAFVLDKLDTRVRTRRGAEQSFGLPVVTEVPRIRRRQRGIITVIRPTSLAAEAYRALRLGLQLMPRWVLPADTGADEDLARRIRSKRKGAARTVLVTSPGPREGKTTTVANLAAGFAETGRTVLVLDCDFRRPAAHVHLGAEGGEGIAEYLRGGKQRPSLASLAQRSTVAGVRVVPSGRAIGNPAELLGSDSPLLRDATRLADIVLIDCGPLLAVNDGATLASQVDAVVVVARSGRTTVEEAHRASELLARVGAPVLGVALVGMRRSDMGTRYHYPGLARHTDAGVDGEGETVDGTRSWSPATP